MRAWWGQKIFIFIIDLSSKDRQQVTSSTRGPGGVGSYLARQEFGSSEVSSSSSKSKSVSPHHHHLYPHHHHHQDSDQGIKMIFRLPASLDQIVGMSVTPVAEDTQSSRSIIMLSKCYHIIYHQGCEDGKGQWWSEFRFRCRMLSNLSQCRWTEDS